jgi:hypothetical protein
MNILFLVLQINEMIEMLSKKRTRTYPIFFSRLKEEAKAKRGDQDNDLITKNIYKFLKKSK